MEIIGCMVTVKLFNPYSGVRDAYFEQP